MFIYGAMYVAYLPKYVCYSLYVSVWALTYTCALYVLKLEFFNACILIHMHFNIVFHTFYAVNEHWDIKSSLDVCACACV